MKYKILWIVAFVLFLSACAEDQTERHMADIHSRLEAIEASANQFEMITHTELKLSYNGESYDEYITIQSLIQKDPLYFYLKYDEQIVVGAQKDDLLYTFLASDASYGKTYLEPVDMPVEVPSLEQTGMDLDVSSYTVVKSGKDKYTIKTTFGALVESESDLLGGLEGLIPSEQIESLKQSKIEITYTFFDGYSIDMLFDINIGGVAMRIKIDNEIIPVSHEKIDIFTDSNYFILTNDFDVAPIIYPDEVVLIPESNPVQMTKIYLDKGQYFLDIEEHSSVQLYDQNKNEVALRLLPSLYYDDLYNLLHVETAGYYYIETDHYWYMEAYQYEVIKLDYQTSGLTNSEYVVDGANSYTYNLEGAYDLERFSLDFDAPVVLKITSNQVLDIIFPTSLDESTLYKEPLNKTYYLASPQDGYFYIRSSATTPTTGQITVSVYDNKDATTRDDPNIRTISNNYEGDYVVSSDYAPNQYMKLAIDSYGAYTLNAQFLLGDYVGLDIYDENGHMMNSSVLNKSVYLRPGTYYVNINQGNTRLFKLKYTKTSVNYVNRVLDLEAASVDFETLLSGKDSYFVEGKLNRYQIAKYAFKLEETTHIYMYTSNEILLFNSMDEIISVPSDGHWLIYTLDPGTYYITYYNELLEYDVYFPLDYRVYFNILTGDVVKTYLSGSSYTEIEFDKTYSVTLAHKFDQSVLKLEIQASGKYFFSSDVSLYVLYENGARYWVYPNSELELNKGTYYVYNVYASNNWTLTVSKVTS